MKNKWLIGIIAYIGLILLCIVIVYAIPSVRGMLVKTYIAEEGEISLTDDVDAYIIRDEQVYVSQNGGKINRLAGNGELVRAFTTAVEISGEGLERSETTYMTVLENLGEAIIPTENGQTNLAGYVCYSCDGAEGKLTPDTMESIKKKELEHLCSSGSVKLPKTKCAAGDPVFKLVRNSKWYIMFYLKNEDAARYSEGNSVSVSLGGKELRADVKMIKQGKNNSRIILKCGESYDGFLTDRKVDTTVTTASARGLMLEDRSIIEKDGKQGVLVKNKLGNYVFKQIKIKADDGEHCVVYQDIYMDEDYNFVETLGIYDEIVAKPSEDDVAKAQ